MPEENTTIEPQELIIGTADELEEHQLGLEMSVKIAMDHLKKNPTYYSDMRKAGLS